MTVAGRRTFNTREDYVSIANTAPTSQDVVMAAGTLRFGVEKAKTNWGTFFQDMMRSGRGAASSQFENYSGRGPSVVVQNASGEKRVIEVAKTVKAARERATSLRKSSMHSTQISGVSATTYRFPSFPGSPQQWICPATRHLRGWSDGSGSGSNALVPEP